GVSDRGVAVACEASRQLALEGLDLRALCQPAASQDAIDRSALPVSDLGPAHAQHVAHNERTSPQAGHAVPGPPGTIRPHRQAHPRGSAGFPTTTRCGSTSFVTTAPAPITAHP